MATIYSVSNWTLNWRPGVLRRSPEYDAFVRRKAKEKAKRIRTHNWKMEQIALLNKQRSQKGLSEPMGAGERVSGETVESLGR